MGPFFFSFLFFCVACFSPLCNRFLLLFLFLLFLSDYKMTQFRLTARTPCKGEKGSIESEEGGEESRVTFEDVDVLDRA